MVREKDVCWEYAEKLDGNKVKCKFCLRVLNGGISRLKHHLSRLPSKGVNPCSKVRDDVTDKVRVILASKEDGKEVIPTKKPKQAELRSPVSNSITTNTSLVTLETVSPIAKNFPNITQTGPSYVSDQENTERRIALFFFENELDFSVVGSSSYQLMIDSVAKCGNGFKGPSAEALKTNWLEMIKSEVSLQSKEIEKEWTTTGCTIIVETWTDNKSRALINFLISSPSSMFFHKSVDASSYFKNTKFLADLFDSVIQDFGPENIVQIILDNTLNCTSIVNHILQTYGTIFVSPCALQCLDGILKEFSKIDWVNRCILQAQSMTCIGILDDNEFWRAVEECVAVSEPFLKVMREVSGRKPAVGSTYELMTKAKESIRTYYIMDDIKCKTFFDIVDQIWQSRLYIRLLHS